MTVRDDEFKRLFLQICSGGTTDLDSAHEMKVKGNRLASTSISSRRTTNHHQMFEMKQTNMTEDQAQG